MSFSRSTTLNDSKSHFDELRWVIEIRRALEDLDVDGEFPVCIFNVPKLLLASNPECYIPQEVAIGTYHYWRPELYEMDRYKLSAARRYQKQLQCLKLENLVDQLTHLEQRIRACYRKYLNFNGETLVWIMAVDASFLLEFLQVYAIQEGADVPGVSTSMSHLMDYAGRKSAHDAILRDIVMLENQIPLFVLRKMLEFKFSSLEAADEMMSLMFTGLYKEFSLFKKMEDYPKVQVSECAHLLDFFYEMMVPKLEESEIVEAQDQHEGKEGSEISNLDASYVKKFLSELWKLLSKLNKGLVRLIKKGLKSRPLKVIVKLPWTFISNLPGLKFLKKPLGCIFSENKEEKPENGSSTILNSLISKSPLVEEITIPSFTQLCKSGVRFLPTKGCISSINFDAKKCTFYLRTISLDVNTEVFLRNLVAYEASIASGPLVVTRYIELMNGIIDSEQDANLLREKGIIVNHLKSDEEVANLWNGMNKSTRLTKVPFLDEVIEEVNKYYNGRMNVKVRKFMKLYVFGPWQFLTFLAAILLLLLMTLQAFCSVYTCRHIFNVSTNDQ